MCDRVVFFDCPCGHGCPEDACCSERPDTCAKAVEERSTVTVASARVELGFPESVSDAMIARLLRAAKQSADRYLANDFCGGPIPEAVELGVLAYVDALRQMMTGPGTGPSAGGPQVASQTVGSVSITYRDRAAIAGGESEALSAGAAYWAQYRTLILRRVGSC